MSERLAAIQYYRRSPRGPSGLGPAFATGGELTVPPDDGSGAIASRTIVYGKRSCMFRLHPPRRLRPWYWHSSTWRSTQEECQERVQPYLSDPTPLRIRRPAPIEGDCTAHRHCCLIWALGCCKRVCKAPLENAKIERD